MTDKRFIRVLFDGGFYCGDDYVPPVWSITDLKNRTSAINMLEFREESKNLCDDVVNELNKLSDENEELKQREQTLTAKIDRILHQRDGNEKQHLKVMSYLHDNYYTIWEECLKELGD